MWGLHETIRYDLWTSETLHGREWSLCIWCSLTVSKCNADSVSKSQLDCYNQQQVKLLPVCSISASASASISWCCYSVGILSILNPDLIHTSRSLTLSFCLWAKSFLLTFKRRLIEIMFAAKVSSNSTICSDIRFPWMIKNRPHPDSHRASWICLSLPCSSLFLDFISVKPVAIETWLYYASLYYFLWKALATHNLDVCAWIQRCCISNKH